MGWTEFMSSPWNGVKDPGDDVPGNSSAGSMRSRLTHHHILLSVRITADLMR
jgi:hypothetical protein